MFWLIFISVPSLCLVFYILCYYYEILYDLKSGYCCVSTSNLSTSPHDLTLPSSLPFTFFLHNTLTPPSLFPPFLLLLLLLHHPEPGCGSYTCNYCGREIANLRIKCAVCSDFDLCVECFSVGVELSDHKNTHSYSILDSMEFPLFNTGFSFILFFSFHFFSIPFRSSDPSLLSLEWAAAEELLLLEGMDAYGIGNWVEVLFLFFFLLFSLYSLISLSLSLSLLFCRLLIILGLKMQKRVKSTTLRHIFVYQPSLFLP